MNISQYWNPSTPTKHKDAIREEATLPDGVPETSEPCPTFECIPDNPGQKFTFCIVCGSSVEMIRIFPDIEEKLPN